jgi:hypothetical protein
LVTPVGTVNVPVLVKTCMLEKPLAAGTALVHAVPLLVRMLPEVLGATAVTALVPLPMRTALEVSVDAPVPPCDTERVPLVTRRVPLVLGSVSVESAAAAPASKVTEPPPEPLMVTGIR